MDEQLGRLVPLEVAESAGLTVLGTCDWGGCNRPAWGVRWCKELAEYLTVCQPCSRSTWRAKVIARVADVPTGGPQPTDTEEGNRG